MASIEEKELEDFLMEPGNLQHLEIYDSDRAFIKRQFNLGSYGIADIVVILPSIRELHDCAYHIEIIELKKGEVNSDTLIQAARYLAGLRHHMSEIPGLKGLPVSHQITLVGDSLNTSNWVYLGKLLSDVRVWTYHLDLETGIEFEEHQLSNYRLTNPGFCAQVGEIFSELLEPRRLEYERGYKAQNEFKGALALPAPAGEKVNGQEVH